MTQTSSTDLLAQLNWRYATKKFDATKKIPADLWSTLEESLVLTPSSFGLQPWHFFTITDTSIRESLLPHSWNQVQVTECSHFVVLTSRTDIGDAAIEEFVAHVAKVRDVPVDSLKGYRDMMCGFVANMSEDEKITWAKMQTYIALSQLMTSAAALGVDACPMEGIVKEKFDEILNLPSKNLTTSVACALGYRAADDKYAESPKVRFEKSAVISSL